MPREVRARRPTGESVVLGHNDHEDHRKRDTRAYGENGVGNGVHPKAALQKSGPICNLLT
jgi:hypothetical protein